jgi:hypothetical protein
MELLIGLFTVNVGIVVVVEDTVLVEVINAKNRNKIKTEYLLIILNLEIYFYK